MALDQGLKDLAVLAAAANIGCTCGADAGYWESATTHEAMTQKIRAIHDWPDSGVFTEVERLVMLYAEAVTSELLDELLRHLDDAQLGELTAIVAAENLRLRMNAGPAPAVRREVPVAGRD